MGISASLQILPKNSPSSNFLVFLSQESCLREYGMAFGVSALPIWFPILCVLFPYPSFTFVLRRLGLI